MTEFNVGDEVALSTNRGAVAVVEYGPFDGRDVYVVKLVDEPTDGNPRTFTARASVMKPVAKFNVGDVVRSGSHDADGKIVAGPFATRFGTRFYVIEREDGSHEHPREAILTKVEEEPIRVGERVRILRAKWAEEFHGKTGVVTSTSEMWRQDRGDTHPYMVELDDTGGEIHAAELERVEDVNTYVHAGITYYLSAKYRDKDGDYWRFARVAGEVRGGFGSAEDPTEESRTLSYIVERWGPLTRV